MKEKMILCISQAIEMCRKMDCKECPHFEFVMCKERLIANYLIAKGFWFQPAAPGHDNQYNIAEISYINGYEKGFSDGKNASVKHGRWILKSSGRGKYATNWAECSECRVCGSPQWKVCPVCETKMEPPVNEHDPDELMGEYEDENE